MKKRIIAFVTVVILALTAILAGCGGGGDAGGSNGTTDSPDANGGDTGEKTKIVIGGVRSQSGVFAIFDQTAMGPLYRMWADEINKDGGLYVKELDKKLPVELLIYDDKSDLQTMTGLYEKLCTEDKVDLLLPPVSTAFLFAAAQVAQRYGYLLIAGEGGAKELEKSIEACPNFFSCLNFAATQVPALVEIFKEQGIKSAYIVYIEDQHGTEYFQAAQDAFSAAGIELLGEKAVPADPSTIDFGAIINDAKASKAQAFLTFTYPDQGIPLAATSISLDYNPEVYLMGSGGSFDFIKAALAGESGIAPDDMVEGMMAWGAWNEKSSPEAKAFSEKFKAYYGPDGLNLLNNPDAGDKIVYQDWWGHTCYQAVVDIMQQAVENAGALNADGIIDNTKLVDYVKDNHFQTVLGDTWFENNMLAADCYLGNVAQWQKGIFEVIDVGDRRTAEPIVPKPAWPKK
ncbi:MAG: amino acid ABC transporter substrate-binding protein [Clostridiales Family XIII bacterium]|jgi:branched-chain amino acid transport system substrate-binding protein|nr:amino acid ABC transporter substrate-binding protein [Clostridiales Family XIII bacterium]